MFLITQFNVCVCDHLINIPKQIWDDYVYSVCERCAYNQTRGNKLVGICLALGFAHIQLISISNFRYNALLLI